MKVSILTYHYVYNHGANLQALATVEALRSRGVDVEVLDYRPEDLYNYYERTVPPEQAQMHENFCKEYLPLSPRLRTDAEIADYIVSSKKRPDLILNGSDTLLRTFGRKDDNENPKQLYGNPYWFNWLDENEDIKNIPSAYWSVSISGIGFENLPVKQHKENIAKSFHRRCVITVRDIYTKWMIKWATRGLKVNVVDNYDPALFLHKYFDLTKIDISSLKLPEKYILINIPRERCNATWLKRYVEICNYNGYEVIGLPNPQGVPLFDDLKNIIFPIDPLRWYKIIQNASGYVGYRFHALIVALASSTSILPVDSYGVAQLHLLNFNYPSKIFDVCKKANIKKPIRSSLFPYQSPEKIYKKLVNGKNNNNKFIESAFSLYEQRIDELLSYVHRKKQ